MKISGPWRPRKFVDAFDRGYVSEVTRVHNCVLGHLGHLGLWFCIIHARRWRAGITMNRGRQPRVSGGNGMLYMLALHAASKFVQLPRKPPVTASLIAANTLVYLRPGILDAILPRLDEVCLNPYLILQNLDAKRLLLSAFYHSDDAHLIYNMVSLLWKGLQLESSMGSTKFAGMVTVLLGLSHGLVVMVAKLLATYGDNPSPMFSECAVGFSSVLFAMKVVLSWDSPDYTNVYGVLVPSRYAAWAELILIQLFVPGTSFLGHLCGILAGVIYVNSRSAWQGSYSPLTWVKKMLHRPISVLMWPFTGLFLSRQRGRIHGSGRATSVQRTPDNQVWRCRLCTFDNALLATECEMCETPRETDQADESVILPQSPPRRPQGRRRPHQNESSEAPSQPSAPSVEELRRARLDRFGGGGR